MPQELPFPGTDASACLRPGSEGLDPKSDATLSMQIVSSLTLDLNRTSNEGHSGPEG